MPIDILETLASLQDAPAAATRSLPSLGNVPMAPVGSLARAATVDDPSAAMEQATMGEDDRGILSTIGGGAMSGLSAVSNLLGLPVSMVLDLFAGENPLDQWLTPASEENRLYGREFLRKKKLIGEEDTWGNFMAGIALETAVDPLTYLTGPLALAGKSMGLLKKADLMTDINKMLRAKNVTREGADKMGIREAMMTMTPDDIVKEIAATTPDAKQRWEDVLGVAGMKVDDPMFKKPAAGLMGIGLPFREASVSFGTGAKSQRVAKFLDRTGMKFKGLPVVSRLRPLFDRDLRDVQSELLQKHVPLTEADIDRQIRSLHRSEAKDLRSLWKDPIFDIKGTPEQKESALGFSREVFEYLEEVGEETEWKNISPQVAEYREALDRQKASWAKELDEVRRAGGKAAKLSDMNVEYATHQRHLLGLKHTELGASPFGRRAKAAKALKLADVDSVDPYDIRRANPLRDHYGGQAFLNDLSIDGEVSGRAHKMGFTVGRKGLELGAAADQWAAHIFREYKDRMIGPKKSAWVDDFLKKIEEFEDAAITKAKADGKFKDVTDPTRAQQLSLAGADVFKDKLDAVAKDFDMPEGVDITPGELYDKSLNLGRYMAHLDPGHAKHRIPMFETNPFIGAIRRREQMIKTKANVKLITTALGDELYRTLSPVAGGADELLRPAGPGVVRDVQLGKFLEGLKLTGDDSPAAVLNAILKDRPELDSILRDRLGDDLLPKGFMGQPYQFDLSPVEGLTSKEVKAARLADREMAKKLAEKINVPIDLAEDLGRYRRAFVMPESIAPFMAAMDMFSNVWKTALTAMWPAFHSRNFYSGQFQNHIAGAVDTRYAAIDPRRHLQPMFDAHNMATGQLDKIKELHEIPAIKRLIKERDLGDSDAAEILQELIYSENVFGPHTTYAGEIMGMEKAGLERHMPGLQEEKGIKRTLFRPPPEGATRWQRANPLNMAGVGGSTEDVSDWVRVGRSTSDYIEQLNRIAPFVSYLRQGYAPRAAAKRVARFQVDYGNLTDFEKHYARRAFPFYSFTRGILPQTLEELITKPGGTLSRTIQVAGRAHDPAAFTPPHISEGIAIPWPFQEEGDDPTYVRGVGLMHEDALQFFSLDLGDTMLEVMSRLNPLVKGPLEYATGQSFFMRGESGGRRLETMDPQLERIISNVSHMVSGKEGEEVTGERFRLPFSKEIEVATGMTPASRLVGSLRKLTDVRPEVTLPKKMLDFLTGVKVTTLKPYSIENEMRRRARKLMDEMGARKFEKVYFSKEERAKMSPEKRAKAEALMAIMNMLSSRGKERGKIRRGEVVEEGPSIDAFSELENVLGGAGALD